MGRNNKGVIGSDKKSCARSLFFFTFTGTKKNPGVQKKEDQRYDEIWFRERKAGHFYPLRIYAVGDVSESWSFHNGNISYEDYMKQCEGFTASKFDAGKWAELFQKAGAQYGW